jgi:hypothetical protein
MHYFQFYFMQIVTELLWGSKYMQMKQWKTVIFFNKITDIEVQEIATGTWRTYTCHPFAFNDNCLLQIAK